MWKKETTSVIGFNDYTYDKQGDTGLYSLYREVSCQLGGWSKNIIDKKYYNSFEEAEAVGFKFARKKTFDTAITGYDGLTKDITIPSRIKSNGNFRDVKLIGASAFKDQDLKSVILPDNLEQILHSSFENNKLKSVVITQNVKTINNSAFKNNQITQVKFSEDARLEIHDYAFANNKIKSITIPSNVAEIRKEAFDRNNLQEVTIENRGQALTFKIDGKAPADGWITGKFKLTNGVWVKQ